MHTKRRWSLTPIASAEELAHLLTERTWTSCSGFTVSGQDAYLFLNDATCEDGAQEYAVVRRLPDGTYSQIESVTFSWCTAEQSITLIRSALCGEMDGSDFARAIDLRGRLDSTGVHRCSLCA